MAKKTNTAKLTKAKTAKPKTVAELRALMRKHWSWQPFLAAPKKLQTTQAAADAAHYGLSLREMPQFTDDPKVVLAAIGSSTVCGSPQMQLASERLRKDKEFAIRAVTCSQMAILHIDEKLKKDRDVVLALVSSGCNYLDPKCFKDILSRFADDRGIVLAAIRRHIIDWETISPALQTDPEVILTAFNKELLTWRKLADAQKTATVVLILLGSDYFGLIPQLLKDMTADPVAAPLLANLEIATKAVSLNSSYLKYFPLFNANPVVASFAMRDKHGIGSEYVSLALRDDKKFMANCLASNPNAIECASDRLKDDTGLAILVLERSPYFCKYLSARQQRRFGKACQKAQRELMTNWYFSGMPFLPPISGYSMEISKWQRLCFGLQDLIHSLFNWKA